MQASTAHFNLNRLGVIVSSYAVNFYGTDYVTSPALQGAELPGIDSDRLFASWDIRSNRVQRLGNRENVPITATPDARIAIPADWTKLLKEDPHRAKEQLLRTRGDFQNNFDKGLICAAFEPADDGPQYLLYRPEAVME